MQLWVGETPTFLKSWNISIDLKEEKKEIIYRLWIEFSRKRDEQEQRIVVVMSVQVQEHEETHMPES